VNGRTGLSISTDDALAADIRVEEPPVGRRDLWQRLTRPRAFATALQRALAQLADDGATDAATLVEEHGITALQHTAGAWEIDGYADLVESAQTGGTDFWRLYATTRQLGGPVAEFSGTLQSSLDDIEDGPLALLEAADESLTVAIRLSSAFWTDHHRTERERFLRFVVALSGALDVQLVGSRLTARKLVTDHRADLPASVTDRVQSRLSTGGHAEQTAEVARRALDEFDPSSDRYREWWHMLWTIYERPAERRSRHDIETDVRIDVGRTAISKRLGRLSDAGLVERVTINSNQQIRLTPAGVAAMQEYVEEHGRPDEQATAGAHDVADGAGRSPEGCGGPTGNTSAAGGETEAGPSPAVDAPESGQGADVSDPPNSSAGTVLPPSKHEGGEASNPDRPAAEAAAAADQDADGARDGRRSSPRSDWMSLHRHHSTVSAASDGDVVLSDRPASDRTTPGDTIVSYDQDREEVAISVQGDKSVARLGVRLCDALLSEKLLRSVLTPANLDGTDVNLSGLAENNVYVLHRARCIGWLKRGEANGSALQRRLRGARNALANASTHLTGDDGFNAALASELTKDALGLFGTAVHLLDLLDVDVTVEIEWPDYSRNHHSNLTAICRFLARLTRICSRYGHYSAQRTLYEPRQKKREDALGAPAGTHENPNGEALCSWVLAGPGIDKLAAPLRAALDDPPDDDLQEDGVNFAPFIVDVDVVQGWRREAVAELLARMARFKKLEPTRQAIAVFRAFCASVRDVGRAMSVLGREDFDRDLRLDELRFALVEGLPPGRILPDAGASTVSKAVHALLAADRPLSAGDLARRADVSRQSLRDNRALLEASGLVHIEDGEAGDAAAWRLTLPFRDERGEEWDTDRGQVPVQSWGPTDDPPEPLFEADGDGFESRLDWAVEVLLARLDRPLHEDDELKEAVWWNEDDPPDVRPVLARWPSLRPWLDVLAALSGHDYRLAEEGAAFVPYPTGGWSSSGGPPTSEEWGRGPLRLEATVGQRPPRQQAALDEWPGGGGRSAPAQG